MGQPVVKAATYEDLQKVPRHEVRWPRSSMGGWIILDEPELHLGKHVLEPDLAGWRRERMAVVPDRPWHDLAPDWICEELSPSTARYDRSEKREIYAAHKVSHLWFVDPYARTLEAFELQGKKWMLLATRTNDDEIALAPFAAVPFQLGALWAD